MSKSLSLIALLLQDLKKALELSRQEYDYSQLDEPVVPENEESTPAGTFVCLCN